MPGLSCARDTRAMVPLGQAQLLDCPPQRVEGSFELVICALLEGRAPASGTSEAGGGAGDIRDAASRLLPSPHSSIAGCQQSLGRCQHTTGCYFRSTPALLILSWLSLAGL